MYALAYSPSVEVYSIDEAFLDLDRIDVDIDKVVSQGAQREHAVPADVILPLPGGRDCT